MSSSWREERSSSATRVEERVAIVTGGASGVGLVTARLLVTSGHAVVVADLRDDVADALTDVDPDGQRSLAVRADVTDTASVDAMVAATLQRFGRLDVLVNNAGYVQPSPTHELDDADWLRMLDVHLNGTLRCARSAFPALVAAGGAAAVVNLASIAAHVGMPMRASYTAAKAGIEGLTRSLAIEWATVGIRVNAVAPGFVRTPLMQALTDEGKNPVGSMTARVPMGRMAEPAEIAAVIAFLASPEASYVTGQTIIVDGGMTVDGRLHGVDDTAAKHLS